MEFVALQETFYEGKFIKAGANVVANTNLAKQYPNLFKVVAVAAAPVVSQKTETKEPEKTETKEPEKTAE